MSVAPRSVEDILLCVTQVRTFAASRPLTAASGFFFRCRSRLYLVTSRHVMADGPSGHFPDRVEIDIHTDRVDLTRCIVQSLPLYSNGGSLWRQASDSAGAVDVATLEIDAGRLPASAVVGAFEMADLESRGEVLMMGDPLVVIGFPLGFHDTVHHLAVARRASIASAYGVRFQGQGYFLTDGRTHRGSSGSPVVRRRSVGVDEPVPGWQLLGVHSMRMDMRTRDAAQDESLGLNCAWYADILAVLTQPEEVRSLA